MRKLNVMEDQNVRDQTQVTAVLNAHGQIAFYVLRSFFDEIQNTNESWLHTCRARVITTWRLGLQAPLVSRNKGVE